jgi:hypothetical protein
LMIPRCIRHPLHRALHPPSSFPMTDILWGQHVHVTRGIFRSHTEYENLNYSNTGTVVDISKHHRENIESSIPVHTSSFIQFFTMRCLLHQAWGFNTKLKRLKWPSTTIVDLVEGQKAAELWGFLPSLQLLVSK